MSGILRLTAIALSVLVFAVVLTVCGESGACGGCLHAFCEKTDRPDRHANRVVARVMGACENLVRAFHRTPSTALAFSFGGASTPPTPSLLVSKAAQLRI